MPGIHGALDMSLVELLSILSPWYLVSMWHHELDTHIGIAKTKMGIKYKPLLVMHACFVPAGLPYKAQVLKWTHGDFRSRQWRVMALSTRSRETQAFIFKPEWFMVSQAEFRGRPIAFPHPLPVSGLFSTLLLPESSGWLGFLSLGSGSEPGTSGWDDSLHSSIFQIHRPRKAILLPKSQFLIAKWE